MLERKWKRQVPVYLFTGFLESGKTTFMNESMAEPEFTAGERNLCILCEEGEAEPDFTDNTEISIEYIEDEASVSKEYFLMLNEKYKPEKILIEYNGMWKMEDLYLTMPDNWIICQEMTFVDSGSFTAYNMNMRNLVYDKLKYTDMVIFNRFEEDYDVMEFHKTVRNANRNAQIIYESPAGKIQVDEIEDPLPFDVEADTIELEDRDYAYWYQDIMAEPDVYKGKTMILSAMVKSKGIEGKDRFVVGRPLMTCCAEDIEFAGMRCIAECNDEIEHNKWARIEGTVHIAVNKKEDQRVPVIHVSKIEYTDMPDNVLATFY